MTIPPYEHIKHLPLRSGKETYCVFKCQVIACRVALLSERETAVSKSENEGFMLAVPHTSG